LPARESLSSVLDAAALVAKYAAVLVTDLIEPECLFPLLTARQNIYTDPQKPVQVEPGLYPINNPGRDAPLLVTTNFSLTYFTVRGEIENSRVGSLLLVIDTEGTSVLTAWAADKLNPRVINQALEKTDAAGAIDQKRLVLPGYVAVLSGKLEEESGWEVKVGPREASGIPRYLRNFSA
jgi:acetyl-CoA decarbonylase/synthase complex subunit gamma